MGPIGSSMSWDQAFGAETMPSLHSRIANITNQPGLPSQFSVTWPCRQTLTMDWVYCPRAVDGSQFSHQPGGWPQLNLLRRMGKKSCISVGWCVVQWFLRSACILGWPPWGLWQLRILEVPFLSQTPGSLLIEPPTEFWVHLTSPDSAPRLPSFLGCHTPMDMVIWPLLAALQTHFLYPLLTSETTLTYVPPLALSVLPTPPHTCYPCQPASQTSESGLSFAPQLTLPLPQLTH